MSKEAVLKSGDGTCQVKAGGECCGAHPTREEVAEWAEEMLPGHKCILQRAAMGGGP